MNSTRAYQNKSDQTMYLLSGDYRTLLSFAVPKMGLSRVKLRLSLHLAYYFSNNEITEQQQNLVSRLNTMMGDRITSFMLHAIDKNQTRWQGVFESDDQLYGVKVFQNHEDAYHEYAQTKIVEQHFTGPFIVPSIVNCQEGFLISRFVSRERHCMAEDGVLDRLIYHTKQAVENCTAFKIPVDIVPLNYPGLFLKLENSDLIRRVKKWLSSHPDQIPMIPIHGDMTPWNIFVDTHEKLVLTSFERAGWHVPFYDVFHFHLQPQALLSRQPAPLSKLLNDNMPWGEYKWLKSALMLYLIDQLCCDLSDFHDKQYNDIWLSRMIRNKEAWLEEVLDSEDHI
jgi:hypothetical protein